MCSGHIILDILDISENHDILDIPDISDIPGISDIPDLTDFPDIIDIPAIPVLTLCAVAISSLTAAQALSVGTR